MRRLQRPRARRLSGSAKRRGERRGDRRPGAGAGLGYYIDQAGGYRQDAAEDRTHVRFANGEIATRGGGFLFFGGGVPDPDPGSEIRVPVEPPREEGGLSTGQWITLITSVLGSITTVVVASN